VRWSEGKKSGFKDCSAKKGLIYADWGEKGEHQIDGRKSKREGKIGRNWVHQYETCGRLKKPEPGDRGKKVDAGKKDIVVWHEKTKECSGTEQNKRRKGKETSVGPRAATRGSSWRSNPGVGKKQVLWKKSGSGNKGKQTVWKAQP